MLAVGPLGPQYSWIFAWHELGSHAHLEQRVWKKLTIVAKSWHDLACPLSKWKLRGDPSGIKIICTVDSCFSGWGFSDLGGLEIAQFCSQAVLWWWVEGLKFQCTVLSPDEKSNSDWRWLNLLALQWGVIDWEADMQLSGGQLSKPSRFDVTTFQDYNSSDGAAVSGHWHCTLHSAAVIMQATHHGVSILTLVALQNYHCRK